MVISYGRSQEIGCCARSVNVDLGAAEIVLIVVAVYSALKNEGFVEVRGKLEDGNRAFRYFTVYRHAESGFEMGVLHPSPHHAQRHRTMGEKQAVAFCLRQVGLEA